MLEDSSVTRSTVEDVAPHATVCPITPEDEVTAMPTERPEEVPLSMVTVEDQESLEPEIM
jgi:hypothetical protein